MIRIKIILENSYTKFLIGISRMNRSLFIDRKIGHKLEIFTKWEKLL